MPCCVYTMQVCSTQHKAPSEKDRNPLHCRMHASGKTFGQTAWKLRGENAIHAFNQF